MKRNAVIVFLSLLCAISCSKNEITPEDNYGPYNPTPVEMKVPAYFPIVTLPDDNPLTAEGIALGRKLYYDKIVDATHTNSCSSCHQQTNAFSSPQPGLNVIQHQNLAWSRYFLWNGMLDSTLEDAMLFEVKDFLKTNLDDLNANEEYKKLFWQAFGVTTITYKEEAYAIAQFLRTAETSDSRYDRSLRHEIFLTDEELEGYTLFFTEKGDCFHCHPSPLFTDQQFRNNGLDATYTADNWGRYEVTGDPADMGKYKSPSLRNCELTAPYMHDGRYQTLEEVVEFYNSGVHLSPTVDPIMTKPGKENGLQLNEEQKHALVAFLKALTDSSFINNTDLSSPF